MVKSCQAIGERNAQDDGWKKGRKKADVENSGIAHPI
jgi:hypothetical protein